MISYAQNFEDVILWRALKDVERGFYIDIGAQDPLDDSVSLTFYEHGWRGVHVEPTAAYAARLREARPDEEVVQAAIGCGAGLLTFYEIPGTGLSTGDKAVADRLFAAGYEAREIALSLVTLADVLERYRGRDIHWLKIDVEGMERSVIDSWGTCDIRPWIVVVESRAPISMEQTHGEWEHALMNRGYEFVYFDGLNRFFLASGRSELKEKFGPGFNIFDEFVVSRNSWACRPIIAELESEHRKMGDVRAVLEARLAEQHDAYTALEARLAEQYEEKSRFLDEQRQPVAWHLGERAMVEKRVESLQQNLDVTTGRLNKLLYEFQMEDGPRALRILLPIARLIRRVHRMFGSQLIAVPPALARDSNLMAPAISRMTPLAPRESIMRRVCRELYYSAFRPLVRPLASRAKSFLLGEIITAVAEIRQELAEIRHGAPAPQSARSAEARMVRILEDALVTILAQTGGRSSNHPNASADQPAPARTN